MVRILRTIPSSFFGIKFDGYFLKFSGNNLAKSWICTDIKSMHYQIYVLYINSSVSTDPAFILQLLTYAKAFFNFGGIDDENSS